MKEQKLSISNSRKRSNTADLRTRVKWALEKMYPDAMSDFEKLGMTGHSWEVLSLDKNLTTEERESIESNLKKNNVPLNFKESHRASVIIGAVWTKMENGKFEIELDRKSANEGKISGRKSGGHVEVSLRRPEGTLTINYDEWENALFFKTLPAQPKVRLVEGSEFEQRRICLIVVIERKVPGRRNKTRVGYHIPISDTVFPKFTTGTEEDSEYSPMNSSADKVRLSFYPTVEENRNGSRSPKITGLHPIYGKVQLRRSTGLKYEEFTPSEIDRFPYNCTVKVNWNLLRTFQPAYVIDQDTSKPAAKSKKAEMYFLNPVTGSEQAMNYNRAFYKLACEQSSPSWILKSTLVEVQNLQPNDKTKRIQQARQIAALKRAFFEQDYVTFLDPVSDKEISRRYEMTFKKLSVNPDSSLEEFETELSSVMDQEPTAPRKITMSARHVAALQRAIADHKIRLESEPTPDKESGTDTEPDTPVAEPLDIMSAHDAGNDEKPAEAGETKDTA